MGARGVHGGALGGPAAWLMGHLTFNCVKSEQCVGVGSQPVLLLWPLSSRSRPWHIGDTLSTGQALGTRGSPCHHLHDPKYCTGPCGWVLRPSGTVLPHLPVSCSRPWHLWHLRDQERAGAGRQRGRGHGCRPTKGTLPASPLLHVEPRRAAGAASWPSWFHPGTD